MSETDLATVHLKRAQDRLGRTLKGKYTLQDLLGIGGMCAVYKAVHRNGHKVAIKMLHLELSLDEEARRRFLKEGYAANNVDHPGVVRVTDDDIAEDGSVFVVMELLEGDTLDALSERGGGRLPHSMVMNAAYQLLDILAAAEDKGVLHRDIKPANLFWTTEGTLKLLDFGIARMIDSNSGAVTASGRVFGTPAFMSPEQVMGKREDVDHRSDLWAVGATMFTLLSGRYVHEADTPMQQMLHTASRPATKLEQAVKGIPREIAAIVDKALSFNKNERYPNARAMQQAVEDAYQRVYGTAPPVVRVSRYSIPAPMPSLPRNTSADTLDQAATLPRTSSPQIKGLRGRGPVLAAGIFVAGAMVVVGLWFALSGGDGPETMGQDATASVQSGTAVAVTVASVEPAASVASAVPVASASSSAKTVVGPGPISSKRVGPGKKPGGKKPFDYQ